MFSRLLEFEGNHKFVKIFSYFSLIIFS